MLSVINIYVFSAICFERCLFWNIFWLATGFIYGSITGHQLGGKEGGGGQSGRRAGSGPEGESTKSTGDHAETGFSERRKMDEISIRIQLVVFCGWLVNFLYQWDWFDLGDDDDDDDDECCCEFGGSMSVDTVVP